MLNHFRHPRLNGMLFGLLQGIPQGLYFTDQKPFVGAGFDEEMTVILALMGVIVPPLCVAFSHAANRGKELRWWAKMMEYVNPYHLMFWGGVSLAASAFYSLRSQNAFEGYAVCAFFAASGFGFFIGGQVENWLKKRNAINSI